MFMSFIVVTVPILSVNIMQILQYIFYSLILVRLLLPILYILEFLWNLLPETSVDVSFNHVQDLLYDNFCRVFAPWVSCMMTRYFDGKGNLRKGLGCMLLLSSV